MNRLVAALLRSRAHRLLSKSTMLMTYRGRRSGELFTFPCNYAVWGDQLVVVPGRAGQKLWWRNLLDPAPVTVVVRGREHHGRARALELPDPIAREALVAYGRRFPRTMAKMPDQRVVVMVDLEAGEISEAA